MLTKEEQALAANANILLTKNKIIQEVYELFGRLAAEYQTATGPTLPADIQQIHPKISRGENYLGLPWVMLDWPRHFANQNTFAIRTMFWWGHYFSLHLLLQGDKMHLLNAERLPQASGWYFTTGTDPWQHQFDPALALAAKEVQVHTLENQAPNGFYKISVYLPLQEWDKAEDFLKEKFAMVLQLVRSEVRR